MLVRLWWKEFRVFGPVCLTLLIAAVLFQWLMYSARNDDVRGGALTFSALCWAVLYAFAVGSAAFSGEREGNTQGFLDALPVPRPILWLGKATFAFVSTAVLVALLLALGEFATTERPASGTYSWPAIFDTFAPILLGGLGWGLFWSSLSKNTLMAAVLAVLSVAATFLTTLDQSMGQLAQNQAAGWSETSRLLIPLAPLSVSLIALAWRPNWGWAVVRNRPERAARPIVLRASSTGRSLFWQAGREGGMMMLVVALMALSIPIVQRFQGSRVEEITHAFLATLAGLVAGVSVFGSENAVGSRRFLVHHGVRAHAIWWRRLLTWGVVLGGLLFAMSLAFEGTASPAGNRIFREMYAKSEYLLLVSFMGANAFGVGLVSGMAIRRRITAVLVGSVFTVALIVIQIGLLTSRMIPFWSLVLTPTLLLGISAAWANDWLEEPEGFRRWVRLGLMVGLPFGALGGGYLAYRGFGVEDFGRQDVLVRFQGPPLAPDQNAAEVYRRAIGLIRRNGQNRPMVSLQAILENGWNPDDPGLVQWWRDNLPAIELAKQASTRPRAQFTTIDRMTLGEDPEWPTYRDLRILELFVGLDVRERMSRGDLAGSWEDIVSIFRTANLVAEALPTTATTSIASQIHHEGIGLAFEWLADPRQTTSTVRKALGDIKGLPVLPDLSRSLQVESALIEKALDLPGDELAALLFHREERKDVPPLIFFLESRFVCGPWERLRARRIGRKLIAQEISTAATEVWQQKDQNPDGELVQEIYLGSPLARTLFPPIESSRHWLDNESVNRRGLLQVLALLTWKLEHDGKDAATLDELVPGLLERLPLDPYSGSRFGYVSSEGQEVYRPIIPDGSVETPNFRPSRVGQRLLYSVGQNRSIPRRRIHSAVGDPRTIPGDFIYPIP